MRSRAPSDASRPTIRERSVLVHGDVHQWNALVAGDGYRLVDPDGLVAEAEYDLGIIMREDPVELMDDDPRQRARWLAARTGLDADAIWEWGVVERVCDGLLLAEIELQPVAREMLAAADHIARVDGRPLGLHDDGHDHRLASGLVAHELPGGPADLALQALDVGGLRGRRPPSPRRARRSRTARAGRRPRPRRSSPG